MQQDSVVNILRNKQQIRIQIEQLHAKDGIQGIEISCIQPLKK